jgi:putative membrane protein
MFLLISPLVESLINVAVFTLAGLLLFALAFFVMGKATPFSIRKEIEEDQNVALAIVIGAVIIGISLIIVASIAG